jgi:hypothetical protein
MEIQRRTVHNGVSFPDKRFFVSLFILYHKTRFFARAAANFSQIIRIFSADSVARGRFTDSAGE